MFTYYKIKTSINHIEVFNFLYNFNYTEIIPMINEKFLHYVWQFKRFNFLNLKTTDGESLEIINTGIYNNNQGPDFKCAQIKINDLLWNGNVEIHLKSSDWNKHKHEGDDFYKSIVLHVVYEHDQQISSLKNQSVSTLELKSYIDKVLIDNYVKLIQQNYTFIPCEKFCNSDLLSKLSFSYESLYLDKLQSKCEQIYNLYKSKKNNWEAVLASILAYTMGLKINAESFEEIFNSIDFKIIQKNSYNSLLLESLFFGLTHQLSDYSDEYPRNLKKEFDFLRVKFNITDIKILLNFFRLRPGNFPTIRLSQLASLLTQYQNLFSYVVGAKNIQQYYVLLDEVQASSYWNNHFTFDKISTLHSVKKLTSSQKELIIMNCFLPVKFAYSKSIGQSMDEEIISLISELKAEKNSIIDNFEKLGLNLKNALETQAILYLYKEKCSKVKCLECSIGYHLLQ
ncbi:DUF2851 family protein [Apibacter muscae]|uniref:DUF2851 family protein n=1 Tax=Apibacter muscae TaxID=2509004 RepID=A0A563DBM1_9FLAO|nr:DUF2851 family protein [Apibacter muscae]TWP27459.1 DUF2851 family protein [Apibacter muscae]